MHTVFNVHPIKIVPIPNQSFDGNSKKKKKRKKEEKENKYNNRITSIVIHPHKFHNFEKLQS